MLQASIQFAKGAGLCGCSIDHPIGSYFTEALGRLVSKEKGWQLYSESILVTADFTTPEIFDLQKRLQSIRATIIINYSKFGVKLQLW